MRYIRKPNGKTSHYHYRRRVPLDVRATFGREWVEQSLGTANKRDAEARAAMVSAELVRKWDALRGGTSDLERWRQGNAWLAQQEPIVPADDDGEPGGSGEIATMVASDMYEQLVEAEQRGKPLPIPPGATRDSYVAWLRGQRMIPERPRVTLEDACKEWLKERRPTMSVESAAKRVVKQFMSLNEGTALDAITRLQVRQYRDGLVAAGTAPGSIVTYLAHLRTIYAHALNEGLIPERVNPFTSIRVERHKAAEDDRLPIPRDKCLAILRELLTDGFDQSDWFAAALLTTGGRPGGIYRAKLVLDAKVPYWQIPREKRSPPRAVPVHPLLLDALNGKEPPRWNVRAEQLRRQFIERHAPYTAYQCRHSFNDEARRVDMPLELRLRIMGQSARKVIGENARYGSVEAVLEVAPEWISKMWKA